VKSTGRSTYPPTHPSGKKPCRSVFVCVCVTHRCGLRRRSKRAAAMQIQGRSPACTLQFHIAGVCISVSIFGHLQVWEASTKQASGGIADTGRSPAWTLQSTHRRCVYLCVLFLALTGVGGVQAAGKRRQCRYRGDRPPALCTYTLPVCVCVCLFFGTYRCGKHPRSKQAAAMQTQGRSPACTLHSHIAGVCICASVLLHIQVWEASTKQASGGNADTGAIARLHSALTHCRCVYLCVCFLALTGVGGIHKASERRQCTYRGNPPGPPALCTHTLPVYVSVCLFCGTYRCGRHPRSKQAAAMQIQGRSPACTLRLWQSSRT
jgi:hypothetical protein